MFKCALADNMKVPPSEISKWAVSDILLMMRYYKERSKQENKGNEVADIETMANIFGASA